MSNIIELTIQVELLGKSYIGPGTAEINGEFLHKAIREAVNTGITQGDMYVLSDYKCKVVND